MCWLWMQVSLIKSMSVGSNRNLKVPKNFLTALCCLHPNSSLKPSLQPMLCFRNLNLRKQAWSTRLSSNGRRSDSLRTLWNNSGKLKSMCVRNKFKDFKSSCKDYRQNVMALRRWLLSPSKWPTSACQTSSNSNAGSPPICLRSLMKARVRQRRRKIWFNG